MKILVLADDSAAVREPASDIGGTSVREFNLRTLILTADGLVLGGMNFALGIGNESNYWKEVVRTEVESAASFWPALPAAGCPP